MLHSEAYRLWHQLRYETIIMRGFARLFDVDEEHTAIGDAFSIFN